MRKYWVGRRLLQAVRLWLLLRSRDETSPGNSLLAVDKTWLTTVQTIQEAAGWIHAFIEQHQSCGDKAKSVWTGLSKVWGQKNLWKTRSRNIPMTKPRAKWEKSSRKEVFGTEVFQLGNPARFTALVTQIVVFSALLSGGWRDKEQWKEQHEGRELSPDDFRQKMLCENVCSALFMLKWLKV